MRSMSEPLPVPEPPWFRSHISVKVAGGFLLSVIGVLATWGGIYDWRFPWADDQPEIARCAESVFSAGRDSEDRLRPPAELSISWEPSTTVSGRLAAQVSWRTVDSRGATSLVEVAGRYGVKSEDDIPLRLDDRQLPMEGMCGHWHRLDTSRVEQNDAYFDGLWVGEKYCFAVNSSDEDGGNSAPYPSVQTPVACEVANE